MEEYQFLDKKAITIMRINAIISAIICFIILFFLYRFILTIEIEKFLPIWVVEFIILLISINLILNILLYPIIRYRRYCYLINEEQIDMKEGLLFITRTILPIERVQKLELNTGPIDRLFHLTNLQVFSAAGILKIRFLKEKDAEAIMVDIKQKLKQKVGDFNEN